MPTSCLGPSELLYGPLNTGVSSRWNLRAAALGPCLHLVLLPPRHGNLLPDHISSVAAERAAESGWTTYQLSKRRTLPQLGEARFGAPFRFPPFLRTVTRGTFLVKFEPVFCVLPNDQSLVLEATMSHFWLKVCFSFKVCLCFPPKVGDT